MNTFHTARGNITEEPMKRWWVFYQSPHRLFLFWNTSLPSSFKAEWLFCTILSIIREHKCLTAMLTFTPLEERNTFLQPRFQSLFNKMIPCITICHQRVDGPVEPGQPRDSMQTLRREESNLGPVWGANHCTMSPLYLSCYIDMFTCEITVHCDKV